MKGYHAWEIAEIVGGRLLAGDGMVEITDFSTDSRTGASDVMFVPVIGERVDAHDFIRDAYGHGMRATFTSREEVLPGTEGMAYIQVENNVAALQRFGAHLRASFSLPIVGITGSVGKTTTKEMVAAALMTRKNTLKTAGNMNSQVGLPKMMVRIQPEHEIAVIEMGMSMPGEMERLVHIAKPECAVMTNIGISHIGQLGSKENIRREKLNIINEFPKGGVLFLNGDDPMLAEIAQEAENIKMDAAQEIGKVEMDAAQEIGKVEMDAAQEIGKAGMDAAQEARNVEMDAPTAEKFRDIKIITYGTSEGCDYRAEEITFQEEGTTFTLCKRKDGQKCHECYEYRQEIHLSVLGNHNVLNALAALAVAEHYGIAMEEAARGLAAYQPIAMRGGKTVKNGITIIDDTYNASPDSMKSGIDILMATKAKRHIAVFADMLELGELSENSHREVGAYLAGKKADFLVAVGTEAEYYRKGASGMESLLFADNPSALKFLQDYLKPGDAVLFKGSRGMKLDEIVKQFIG